MRTGEPTKLSFSRVRSLLKTESEAEQGGKVSGSTDKSENYCHFISELLLLAGRGHEKLSQLSSQRRFFFVSAH
jgi:hypothetical protein